MAFNMERMAVPFKPHHAELVASILNSFSRKDIGVAEVVPYKMRTGYVFKSLNAVAMDGVVMDFDKYNGLFGGRK